MPRSNAQNKAIKAASKKKILDAALRLFSTIGFSQSSVAKIAQEAGVSKGLIYHHFESKDAILSGLLEELWEYEKQFLPDASLPPKVQLSNLLGLVFESTQNLGHVKFLLSLSIEVFDLPQVTIYVQRKIAENMSRYVQLFESLGYEEPEMEAWHFGDVVSGILLHAITAGSLYPLQEMKQYLYHKYQITS